MTEEPNDVILIAMQTAQHLNLGGQNGGEPKLKPDATLKLLPSIEAYVAMDKFSQAMVFIKKFKDFK